MTKLSDEALRQALEQLQGEERGDIVRSARSLSSSQGHALVLLKMLMAESRVTNRHGILHALSWQGNVRAWWPLVKVLADASEFPLVRGQAAEGIAYLISQKRRGTLGYRVALDVLIWALGDPDAEVRDYALFALGASRDPSVLPVIRGMTEDAGRARSIVGSVGDAAQSAIKDIMWCVR